MKTLRQHHLEALLSPPEVEDWLNKSEARSFERSNYVQENVKATAVWMSENDSVGHDYNTKSGRRVIFREVFNIAKKFGHGSTASRNRRGAMYEYRVVTRQFRELMRCEGGLVAAIQLQEMQRELNS